MVNYSEPLDSAFHALADPTRRAVVERLVAGGPAAITTLAEPFEIGLPAFLKHIKVLEESGIIGSRKVGRVRTCRIRAARLREARAWLEEQRALWKGRTDRMAELAERDEKGKGQTP